MKLQMRMILLVRKPCLTGIFFISCFPVIVVKNKNKSTCQIQVNKSGVLTMIKRFKLLTTTIVICILSYLFMNTAMAVQSYYIGNWSGHIFAYTDQYDALHKPHRKLCECDTKVKITKDNKATFIFSNPEPFASSGSTPLLTKKDCYNIVGNNLCNGREFTEKMVSGGNVCIDTSNANNDSANLSDELTLCRIRKMSGHPDVLGGSYTMNNIPINILLYRQN